MTYRYDGMERLSYEKREEWLGDPTPAYVQVYLIAQEYDKKGNRTRFNKDVTSGHTDSYGKSMDLSYTYNAMNALSVITDADDAYYGCAVTCDANNNITAVTESVTTGGYSATLYTSFGYDWANRMQYSQVRAFDGTQKDWRLTRREHGYDAAGRLVNSTYKQWWEEDEEPAGDSVEHAYAGSKHVQNFDGDASYGAVWHWAGAQNSFAAPVKSPNPDTAAQDAYNIANATTPQRKTWQSPTTAGDQRNLFGQGKPMAKDSSGAGADWGTGIESYTTEATVLQIESRLDFDGTVAPTDLDRATDAREKGRIGIFGSALSYAGNSGRVTSEPLGRDLNPLGRGDGYGYMASALNVGKIAPRLPLSRANRGSGFSINNSDQKDPNPDPPASGDTGGGRPSCCDCYTWPCCGMVGAVGGPGFGDKNSCCCPLGCGSETSTCVGDGGIDDCGNVCDLSDSPCAGAGGGPGGIGSLPWPPPGGGCPGCGGGGGGLPTDPGFGPTPGKGAGGGYGGGGRRGPTGFTNPPPGMAPLGPMGWFTPMGGGLGQGSKPGDCPACGGNHDSPIFTCCTACRAIHKCTAAECCSIYSATLSAERDYEMFSDFSLFVGILGTVVATAFLLVGMPHATIITGIVTYLLQMYLRESSLLREQGFRINAVSKECYACIDECMDATGTSERLWFIGLQLIGESYGRLGWIIDITMSIITELIGWRGIDTNPWREHLIPRDPREYIPPNIGHNPPVM